MNTPNSLAVAYPPPCHGTFRLLRPGLKSLLSICILPTLLTSVKGEEPGVRTGAPLERLAASFTFTEGPAADRAGNVFFTDQPNDRILKWSVDGGLSTFLEPSGRSNGLYFDRAGNLIACADLQNQLWSIAADGSVSVLVQDFQGRLLNGPNDLWIHPNDDWIYFTDPFYQRPYWQRDEMEQDREAVYWLSRKTGDLVRVAEDLEKPNGIIGTPDGRLLYVADIGAGKTYAYGIGPDGRLGDRSLFCNLGSDGMTLDVEGNVYLTGKGVTVFNARGTRIDHIPVDETWTANVCFGGKDRDTLFITAGKSLFSIRLRVRGAY